MAFTCIEQISSLIVCLNFTLIHFNLILVLGRKCHDYVYNFSWNCRLSSMEKIDDVNNMKLVRSSFLFHGHIFPFKKLKRFNLKTMQLSRLEYIRYQFSQVFFCDFCWYTWFQMFYRYLSQYISVEMYIRSCCFIMIRRQIKFDSVEFSSFCDIVEKECIE